MLTGRLEELVELRGRVECGGTVVIVGPAGLGKTALLRELASTSERVSFLGGGLAQLMWEPYLPLMRALGVRMRGGDAAAVAEFVVTLVDDGLLLLDDLQCADDATHAVLQTLAGQIPFIGAIRSGEPKSDHARNACERAGMHIVELAPLSHEASTELLLHRNPRLDRAKVQAIIDAAAGNPLFLEELAATAEPTNTLLDAIDGRLASLSDAARLALTTIALRGQPTERDALGEHASAELVAAGLARCIEGRVGLVHGLVGDRARAALDVQTRKRLHERLANALTDPGERARHEAAAGLLTRAVASAQLAAAGATSPLQRARHLALAAACSVGDTSDALRVQAASDFLSAGEPAQTRSLLESVASHSVHAVRARLLSARAAMLLGLAEIAARDAADGLRREVVDEGDRLALRIELLRADGGSLDGEVRLGEARACVELARRLGEHHARSLMVLGTVQLQLCERGWARTLEQAIAAARDAKDFDVELLAAEALLTGSLGLGQHDALLDRVGQLERRARESFLRGWELQFATSRLWLELVVEGRCDDVRTECEALLEDRATALQRDRLEAMRALAMADAGALADAAEHLPPAILSPPTAGRALLMWVDAEVSWLARRDDALERARWCVRSYADVQPVAALATVTAEWAGYDAGAQLDEVDAVPAEYGGARSESEGVRLLRREPLEARPAFIAARMGWQDVQVRGVQRCAWALAEALRLAGDPESARARLRALDAELDGSPPRSLEARIRWARRELGDPPAEPRNADRRGLTRREHKVMSLKRRGYTNALVAQELNLTRATVETHLRHIREKLDAKTIQEALVKYEAGPVHV